jgi:hypothetical protein
MTTSIISTIRIPLGRVVICRRCFGCGTGLSSSEQEVDRAATVFEVMKDWLCSVQTSYASRCDTRYSKWGPVRAENSKVSVDSLILFARVRSISTGLRESLSRGFEVCLWMPNSKHNLENLLLIIVHCTAMILFTLRPKRDDG